MIPFYAELTLRKGNSIKQNKPVQTCLGAYIFLLARMEADFNNFPFEITNGKASLDAGSLYEKFPAEIKSVLKKNNFHVPNFFFKYGYFKNRSKNINGFIIQHFNYPAHENLLLKNAPSGLAIIESIGPSFILSVYESKQPTPMAFKFPSSVKIESNSFQYGVFVLQIVEKANEEGIY